MAEFILYNVEDFLKFHCAMDRGRLPADKYASMLKMGSTHVFHPVQLRICRRSLVFLDKFIEGDIYLNPYLRVGASTDLAGLHIVIPVHQAD